MSEYYVVSSDILPEVLEKVMAAQKMLATGKAKRISEAVKEVGISRGTFYKYKDAVFAFSEDAAACKAIVSLIVRHEKGALAQVVSVLALHRANILSLNQTIPIGGIASLTVTMDVHDMSVEVNELVQALLDLEVVDRAELVAVG